MARAGVRAAVGRRLPRPASPGARGTARRAALRPGPRGVPQARGHARAHRTGLQAGRSARAREPRRADPLDLRLARLQVPPGARATGGRLRPRGAHDPRHWRRRPERPALPAHRGSDRARDRRRAGRGHRARQRAGAGARRGRARLARRHARRLGRLGSAHALRAVRAPRRSGGDLPALPRRDRPRRGHDHRLRRLSVTDLTAALRQLAIETPSWGYADSGTRFGVFPQPGRPRDVFEKLDDAAEVHRLTGTAGAVALHFPWDAVDDYGGLRAQIEARGLRVGAVNPNLFQDPDYKLGSIAHPDAAVRSKAVDHLLECVEIARELGSTAQSLWLADGTNYPGQDDLRARRSRMLDALARVYAELPSEQELLVEYKLFEPAFYATDLADWGSALLTCQKLGERARVLVDLGHHAQGVNIEQIVAILADEGRLGGFHFNNRKYADDDLIVGSVNPFELFLIFVELAAGDELPRLTIDQAHNVEAKVEAMVLSVVNIQEAYAKALLVDRGALREAQAAGDVLAGHELLLDAYRSDVRDECAAARAALGAAEDPIQTFRTSGYVERVARERAPQEMNA